MYQVLQVYTSFSFFDNFLSRSIVVAETSPPSRRDVDATLRRRRRNFSLIIWSRAGLGDVSETSRRRRGDVFLLKIIFSRCDVAVTSPRPTGDLKKSPKSRRKNRTCLISPRLPRDPPKSPGDVAATSPRPTETRVANRSPTSLYASEIGA